MSSKCRDYMGHVLSLNDWVDVLPPQNMKWIGKIVEISDGGISLSIDRNQKGVTPAKIRLVMDITMNANPNMPVFPGLTRTSPPGSDEIVDKVIEEATKAPPPSDGGPTLM
jgi:hypothetical protein